MYILFDITFVSLTVSCCFYSTICSFVHDSIFNIHNEYSNYIILLPNLLCTFLFGITNTLESSKNLFNVYNNNT